MRVAHFIQRYPPALGGSEAYCQRLSRHLVENGDEVTVWTTVADELQAFWSAEAVFMAFSHGSNDGQKFIGVFTLALVLGGVLPEFHPSFGVVLLAAIHAIPSDYLEAASLDGARAWQRTLRIMVPLLRPTIVNLVILDFIGKMKQFALVWVMTRGGPM